MPRLTTAAREELAESRRSAITAAAVGVFSERGFRGATVKEIADVAGVAEGTLYLYFRSKRDLLIYAWQQVAVQSLVPLLAQGEMSPQERLQAIVRDRITLMAEHGALMRVMMAEAEHDPTMLAEMASQFGALQEMAERYLGEGMRSGLFTPLPTSVVMRVIVAAVSGMAVTQPFFDHLGLRVPADEAAATLSKLFLHGLLARDERG